MDQESSQVPEEWLAELHQATEQFHAARKELEKWMDANEYRHQERVDNAEEKLKQAEKKVEEIETRIKGKMKR